MRKLILNSIFGILTALACASQSFATLPPPVCQNFGGILTLSSDAGCQILTRSDTRIYFPDLLPTNNSNFRFLASLGVVGTCFTGTLTEGTLDGQTITGTSYSGQTTNSFPTNPTQPLFNSLGLPVTAFSAATTLILKNQAGFPLGNIYFRDTGLINLSDGSTSEQLVVVGANGLFWGIKGTVQINGNEFTGAPVTGQFCR